MKPPTLDPSLYTIAPGVAIVDEFVMNGGDGVSVTNIDEMFLTRLVQHMNDREAATGDLCPIVIGHTPDEPFDESCGPPVIGYLRNWRVGPLFSTGRKAAMADAWVMNDEVERAKRFPRRSAEIYVNRHEVDPCSFLGPTTPARDLGLLKLSRDSAGNPRIVYDSPYQNPEFDMPTKDEVKADPKETGSNKEMLGLLQQLVAGQQQLAQAIAGMTAAPPKPEETPAEPEGNEGPEPSDEEMLKMLGGDDSRKEEKPVKESAACGQGGGNDTYVPDAAMKKMQREHDEMRTKLARSEVREALHAAKNEGWIGIDPDDAKLVEDLIILPDDVRTRTIDRMKLKRGNTGESKGLMKDALRSATDGESKRMTEVDMKRIVKLARDENKDFAVVARREGFTL